MAPKKRAASVGAMVSPAKVQRALTIPQKAAQRLRENFACLSDEEKSGVVDEATGLTLRDRRERDLKLREAGQVVRMGKWYNDDLKTTYRSESSLFQVLKPDADDASVVSKKAMQALHECACLQKCSFERP